MNTSKPQNYKWAFVLKEEDLYKLEHLLAQNISSEEGGNATYEVGLSDRSVISASSVEEVLDIPNSTLRRITSVIVTTGYRNSEIHVRLSLENNKDRPISYHLTGKDNIVLLLADKLDEYLVGLRPWYSPLTRFSFVFALFVLFMMAFLLIVVAAAADYFILDILPDSFQSSGDSSSELQSVLYGVLTVAFAICFLLDLLLKRICPVGTFAVSQGLKQYENLGRIRAAVLVTIVLSIPAGLLVNYIS